MRLMPIVVALYAIAVFGVWRARRLRPSPRLFGTALGAGKSGCRRPEACGVAAPFVDCERAAGWQAA